MPQAKFLLHLYVLEIFGVKVLPEMSVIIHAFLESPIPSVQAKIIVALDQHGRRFKHIVVVLNAKLHVGVQGMLFNYLNVMNLSCYNGKTCHDPYLITF